MEQFKLTIFSRGPVDALVERLVGLVGICRTSKVRLSWDSGIPGVPNEAEGSQVEFTTDPVTIMVAVDVIGGWLAGTDESDVLVEIQAHVLSRPLSKETPDS